MNFVLYIGHLGRREPVVQPATTKGSLDPKVVGFVLGKGRAIRGREGCAEDRLRASLKKARARRACFAWQHRKMPSPRI